MAQTLKDFVAEDPVERGVQAHKERLLAEVGAYRLRALPGRAGLTQAQLAERIGVAQCRPPRTGYDRRTAFVLDGICSSSSASA